MSLSPQHIPLFFFFFLPPFLYLIIIFCKKSIHSLALTNTTTASMVDEDIHSADIDEVGGDFDVLTSCTESVGYESSVEMEDEFDEIIDDDDDDIKDSCSWRLGRSEAERRRKGKKFPPPISSLSQDGKPTFFLRPVRKDGRLKLRQVRSNWPETLLASRKDGRLRMHLIYSSDDDQDSRENSEQEDEDDVDEDAIIEEEEEEERGMECKFPVTPKGGGGDGSRRCYRYGRTSHHHHHAALLVCRQPYVSTR